MRGKGFWSMMIIFGCRITPAYAGKSAYVSFSSRHLQDHPRLCGEKLDGRFLIVFMTGSPPPMRGKDHAPVAQQH